MSDRETPEQAAERLLPCNCSLHGSVAATSLHDPHCHARLRPAVAAALGVSEDDRRSLTAERDRPRAALEVARPALDGLLSLPMAEGRAMSSAVQRGTDAVLAIDAALGGEP